MDSKSFRKHAHEIVDWIADYYDHIEEYPVKSQVAPQEVFNKFSPTPPSEPVAFEESMAQFNQDIMPGITHWQHPNFHAYFPANTSFPSILGEMLMSGLGAQCMIWETSPAAAELEEVTMNWFKEMMNLPRDWSGVIQDTASTSTLAALLVARERATDWHINQSGFDQNKLRIYCSTQTHSSIDKAVKIAGFGIKNLVKVAVDDRMAMRPEALNAAIQTDLKNGLIPCAVVTTLGTTSTIAMDPLEAINDICHQYGIWNHIDAAYAGNAFILPDYQHYINDLHRADSYVFNPHKWLFVNFDCSAFFIKDKEALLKTFEILPEYLKTGTRGIVHDYRDWGIPLGRRFRALKLWLVIQSYGVEGLKAKLAEHMAYAQWLEEQINEHPDLEMLVPRSLNIVVFRYKKEGSDNLDELNKKLLLSINESGKAYLTHTKVGDNYALRLVTGQTFLEMTHVKAVWELICDKIKSI